MKNQFKLRDYQQKASEEGTNILAKSKILILNFEVRTGKTHIALDIAKTYNRVLFVTTKKAISSIESDFEMAGHEFDLTVINYESLHKVTGEFDLVICDESHKLGAYPKPSKRVKLLRSIVKNDLILVTGTLTPESPSQLFHQLWISPFNPICFANFYKFFAQYGTKKTIRTPYGDKPDYSGVNYNLIAPIIDKIKLSFTQKEAGFTSIVEEEVLFVHMDERTTRAIKRLKADKFLETERGVVMADTGAKMMSKIHQMSSGTVKFESGESFVFDYSKAFFIKHHFKGQKIAIFYKFTAELEAIKRVFEEDVTTDLDEFNSTDKSIALQIVSGREGVNLSKAEFLVYYNIDFSAVSYWQSRDRLTTKERTENKVFWIFSKGGIETKIYKSVMNKKDFTLATFRRLYD